MAICLTVRFVCDAMVMMMVMLRVMEMMMVAVVLW